MKMNRFVLISLLFTLSALPIFAQVDAKIPAGEVVLFDGFENGNYWIWGGDDWDQYGDHKFSSGAIISKKWASEGKHSLECPMEPMPTNSSRSAIWFFDGTNDLTNAKYLIVDFYNPEDYTFEIAAVLQTTENWNWRQTTTYKLPKGKHTIVFNISDFSDELYDVRRIAVTHNGTSKGTTKETRFYIDNIRYVR